MIETLYNALIGSLLILGIALVWVIIVAIIAASFQQLRKLR